MNLREAKKKRVGAHIKAQQPFPIFIESESEYSVDSELWATFIGTFNGDCVVVSNPEEMKSLYTMGFFGKGSYSRGYPSFGLSKKGIPHVIKGRQWERRKDWMVKKGPEITSSLNSTNIGDGINLKDGPKVISSEKATNEPTPMEVENYKDDSTNCEVTLNPAEFEMSEVLVLADSDNEDPDKVIYDPQPHLEQVSSNIVNETLNLTLEEAFFLSYGLGCLQVIDLFENPLDLKDLWLSFSKVKPDFVESYVVYHYFRAKGWIVKSGFKFGGDFLLYKQGPPFYHASYIVLVEKVDSQLKRYKESLNWTRLHGLNRLAENSGKDIIICQVVCPGNLTREDSLSPLSLSRYQVGETLIKRWIPSQERVEKEGTLLKD